MKKSIIDFRQMAKDGDKIVYITGYDYLTAKYEERAGVDMILIGDSLGMVTLGHDTTYPVTMDDMIAHSSAVRRGAPNTFIIGDMPYMSYQISDEEAVFNAGDPNNATAISATGADSKLVGGFGFKNIGTIENGTVGTSLAGI
ncbi:MAG: 3-methyl-2-oxobutanoate hydroxymethyltransferase, partial [Eubacterium sp.]